MKIKVCGMREPENLAAVGALRPDYIGLIFYSRSLRYAGGAEPTALSTLPEEIRKVGVFVNETPETIRRTIERYGLDAVQLHGGESPEFCRELKEYVEVIKTFPVRSAADFAVCGAYERCCDLFLFDTKTEGYGGSGVAFDWNLLGAYRGGTAFLLSGGIGAEDVAKIRAIGHPRLAGVDLNSRFETEPGVKDVFLLEKFINELNHE